MTINEDSRRTLFQHPPSKIDFDVQIPARAELRFGIGLSMEVWDPNKGDGVRFSVLAESTPIFDKYIDPKNDPADRRWFDYKIDLSKYVGKQIRLSFVTDPGPRFDDSYDWAGWSNPMLLAKGPVQERILEILVCPECHSSVTVDKELGLVRCSKCEREYPLHDDVPFMTGTVESSDPLVGNVGSNPYSPHALELIEKHKNGLILNCGAGYPPTNYGNVVELEIARYPSTDIVGDALKLPFQDCVFDAVICESVVEHVRNPFLLASEIWRVTKPGGEVTVDSAFLQPIHGYPHHYFNTTLEGLGTLFERFEKSYLDINNYQEPWIMLRWVLRSYLNGTKHEKYKTSILNMTLREIMDVLDKGCSDISCVEAFRSLTETARRELAAGVSFHGRKRRVIFESCARSPMSSEC
jgi:uncharacterized protein YbaR (Trm112 family)/predicted SAM-dependent methyltransferase